MCFFCVFFLHFIDFFREIIYNITEELLRSGRKQMRSESIAILDIRSSEVTFLLGGKGVNGTFVFRGSKTEDYDGFLPTGFLGEREALASAILSCMNSVLQNYDGEIREIYVGVPSAFTRVYTKGQTISFPSKRRLKKEEFDSLFEAGLAEVMPKERVIHRSAMYFSLGDNRKYFTARELYGAHTAQLQGALSYYCMEESLYAFLQSLLKGKGFSKISYLPQSLVQALTLLPQKAREGYAFFLDIGFLTSSLSVVYGSGVVRETVFDGGKGKVLFELMEKLNVPYEKAEEILSFASVSGGVVGKDVTWTDRDGQTYLVSTINDVIKCALDSICERVDAFLDEYYKGKSTGFTSNPLFATGEGIHGIRGGIEHISSRLNRLTEMVCPDIPYYDKPMYASRISLLSYALSQKESRGLKKIITHIFGGK